MITSLILFIALGGAFTFPLSQRYGTPLRKIPGPFLASFSDFWRYLAVRNNVMPQTSLALHDKHGPLVRIGPGHVCASSPEAIHAIYRAGTGFTKTQVYGLLQPQLEGSDLHNLFSTQDKTFHATLKRSLGSLYQGKAVEGREPNIDRAIQLLIEQLNARVEATGEAVIDLSAWMHFWGFEAMSQDVGDICSMSHANMRYFGLWVMDLVEERKKMPKQSSDVFDQCLALHEDKPKSFTERDVVASTYIRVVTAHDVLAITPRSLVYYLVKHPRVLKKFKDEIASFDKAGKLSPNVKFAETQDMRYVNAVISETLRIHPSTGLIFERYVPAGGIEVHAKYIPGGTTIGVNSWVFNHDKAVFVEDSEVFRPERWIDSTPEQLEEMRNWVFTVSFSPRNRALGHTDGLRSLAGARACIGRQLAMVEMTKLIVDIWRSFEWELVEPEWEWSFDGNWLTTQERVDMRVRHATEAH